LVLNKRGAFLESVADPKYSRHPIDVEPLLRRAIELAEKEFGPNDDRMGSALSELRILFKYIQVGLTRLMPFTTRA